MTVNRERPVWPGSGELLSRFDWIQAVAASGPVLMSPRRRSTQTAKESDGSGHHRGEACAGSKSVTGAIADLHRKQENSNREDYGKPEQTPECEGRDQENNHYDQHG